MKNRGLGRGLDALLSNEGDNVSSKIETTKRYANKPADTWKVSAKEKF
jgi:hypothetical protein